MEMQNEGTIKAPCDGNLYTKQVCLAVMVWTGSVKTNFTDSNGGGEVGGKSIRYAGTIRMGKLIGVDTITAEAVTVAGG